MNWSNAIVVTILPVVAFFLLLNTEGAEAKRGCQTFGHSCYGGMGKRMAASDIPNEEELQDVQQQGNSDIVFTGPRKDNEFESDSKVNLQQLYNLSPIVRQWLQSYRRAQELHSNNNNYY